MGTGGNTRKPRQAGRRRRRRRKKEKKKKLTCLRTSLRNHLGPSPINPPASTAPLSAAFSLFLCQVFLLLELHIQEHHSVWDTLSPGITGHCVVMVGLQGKSYFPFNGGVCARHSRIEPLESRSQWYHQTQDSSFYCQQSPRGATAAFSRLVMPIHFPNSTHHGICVLFVIYPNEEPKHRCQRRVEPLVLP